MGPQYAHSSGIVVIILSIPLIFAFANRTPTAIAFGVEKHKTTAQWAIGEGAVPNPESRPGSSIWDLWSRHRNDGAQLGCPTCTLAGIHL